MESEDQLPQSKRSGLDQRQEAELKKLRVWYDDKRRCYSSNAPFIAAKMYGITPMDAAEKMLPYVEMGLKKAGLI